MYTTSIFSTSSGEPHRSPRQATAAPERRLLRRAAPPLVGRALASSYLCGVLGATRALPLPSPSDARTRTRSRSTAPPHAVHTIPRIGHKYRLVSCLSVSSGHTGSAESKNSIGKLPARTSVQHCAFHADASETKWGNVAYSKLECPHSIAPRCIPCSLLSRV